jgi:ribosomal protein S27E
MEVKFFCISCNEHSFKVDNGMLETSRVVTMTCPECDHETVVYLDEHGEIHIHKGKK